MSRARASAGDKAVATLMAATTMAGSLSLVTLAEVRQREDRAAREVLAAREAQAASDLSAQAALLAQREQQLLALQSALLPGQASAAMAAGPAAQGGAGTEGEGLPLAPPPPDPPPAPPPLLHASSSGLPAAHAASRSS